MTIDVLNIAVPVPLFQCFSYIVPEHVDARTLTPGIRIKVPFGNRTLTGILLGSANVESDKGKLKYIGNVIDTLPVFSPSMLEFANWLSSYYQHPIGETLMSCLPSLLRKGEQTNELTNTFITLSKHGEDFQPAKNAKAQTHILDTLKANGPINKTLSKKYAFSSPALKTLTQKNIIAFEEQAIKANVNIQTSNKLSLNDEQQACLDQYSQCKPEFTPILLEGITGSGKTEVYLQLIEQCLTQGKQALILVPEIGLTPQTVSRFAERFNCPIAVLHSSISDKKRLLHWQESNSGIAKIIIGTRSALFSPTQELGLIIIDEEHDLSYKQQDGLKYSARDAAIMRAKLENCPIVLGSATPSLETLHNAEHGKYLHWQLKQRAGNAQQADLLLLDIRHQNMIEGISEQALTFIEGTIQKGEQALIFINRRGYAPTLICHDCGWVSQCEACDSTLTAHLKAGHLRCHHCQSISPIPRNCPNCQSNNLVYQGAGSQRIEQVLQQHFPSAPIFRIDRDSTQSQRQMNELLDNIQRSPTGILVGTQMLAKGHHFPNVTLVVMLEADNGLMGVDYRGLERFGQLLTQVTGRAGRESKKGTALIQTHYPEHPELNQLISHGYHHFALNLLAQRQQLHLPPFSHQALIRLEDKNAQNAMQVLETIRQFTQQHFSVIEFIGPFPAQLQKRAHFYRYQLLLQSTQRKHLHAACEYILQISAKEIRHHQRFSIDIDPQEMN